MESAGAKIAANYAESHPRFPIIRITPEMHHGNYDQRRVASKYQPKRKSANKKSSNTIVDQGCSIRAAFDPLDVTKNLIEKLQAKALFAHTRTRRWQHRIPAEHRAGTVSPAVFLSKRLENLFAGNCLGLATIKRSRPPVNFQFPGGT